MNKLPRGRAWLLCQLLFPLLVLALRSNVQADEVTVYRDQFGVPHIWGDSYGAVGYAVGQCQCQDTLSSVIDCLYTGVGRLSEIHGPSALDGDIEARTLRHESFARAAWPKLSEPLQQLIQGYCDGVNDYLKSHPDEYRLPDSDVPIAVGPVEPTQVLAWHRTRLVRSPLKICRLEAEASKAKPEPSVEPGESNSWALSGAKTASGAPMLLIDPHGPSHGQYQMYELWLNIGDECHVGGFAILGTPLPGLGVSSHAAWTFTAGGADSSDAYELQINPDNPKQYKFDGEWKDMDSYEEVIRVRQEDGTFEEQPIDVMATLHGPVLETKEGVPFAASFGGYERADLLQQFFRMATARTTQEFKAAIAMDRVSYLNLIWATADGDIGYVQTGQPPLRRGNFTWKRMIPGWTSAALNEGKLPFEQLPTVENPLCGFLQNCNVAANVVAPGVPFKIGDFPPGVLDGHYGQYRARGQRLTQLLTEVQDATLEDGRRIAFDDYVLPADLWVPIILQAFNESQRSPSDHPPTDADRRLAEAARLVGTWNRHATRDSKGATVFRFWRLACDEMGLPLSRDDFQVPNTPEVRHQALDALRQAADQLNELYGRVDVPWGDIKRIRRGEQEWPLSGDALGKCGMDCLRATAGDKLNGQNIMISKGGQCTTAVVMLTDPPQIRSVLTYGQSNKPGAKHYADQAPLYSKEQFREVAWTLEDLKDNIESKTTYHYDR